jgi:hypothetical protein
MRNKKKDTKTREASDRSVMASVVEEMAKPRMTKSASMKIDKQIHAREGKSE